MEKIAEHNGNVLYYDAGLSCVRIDWVKFIRKADMVAMRDLADKVIVEKRPTNWIANMADTTTVEQEGQDYGSQTWVPEVASKGIKRMATVLPASFLGKMGTKKIISAFTETYESAEAASLEDAIKWLKN
jgi:hypothetical protein